MSNTEKAFFLAFIIFFCGVGGSCDWDQLALWGNSFSPTMWVPGTKFRLSGLARSVFTHWLQILSYSFFVKIFLCIWLLLLLLSITVPDRVWCSPGCLTRTQRMTLSWSSRLSLQHSGITGGIHCHAFGAYLLFIEWSWCLTIKVVLNDNVLNLFFISVHSASEEIIESKAQEEEPSSLLKYFSVVWCKASKKKHKKWEGDAILIVKGRSFTLKDLEGKDIGRGIVVYYLSYDLVWN